MNSKTYQPENKTDDLLTWIKNNIDNSNKQTETNQQGTVDFKMEKSLDTSYFYTPLNIEDERMLVSNISEIFNSVFNLTKTNKE